MRSQGSRVPKFYWLARIGPKKVPQTRRKPASHLRALDRQKKCREFRQYFGRERMRRQGPRKRKFYCLARIGPKKVLQTRSKPASHLHALDRQKKVSGISSTLRGRKRMRRQGPRVRKFYCLARIGPKKVVQTCSKPAIYLRALDLQKNIGNFVNPI